MYIHVCTSSHPSYTEDFLEYASICHTAHDTQGLGTYRVINSMECVPLALTNNTGEAAG